MLECAYTNPINLVRVWRDRFGFLPPFTAGAVTGWHFVISASERGVVFTRPQRLQVVESLRAQVFAVIGAKHRVGGVRLAEADEKPRLREPDRLPLSGDHESVDEWPSAQATGEPLIAEFAPGNGAFLADHHAASACGVPDAALKFADLAEAEQQLSDLTPRPSVLLRYLAAARAEADQREAASVDSNDSS